MKTSTEIQKLEAHKTHPIAVILHLFYTELFEELRGYLDNLEGHFDLYLSLPEHLSDFETVIRYHYPEAAILLVPNRGRDLAPFVEFLKVILPLGYESLLKIHTKKTLHRQDGTSWRQDVFEKLVGSSANVVGIQRAFSSDKSLAMLGPWDHVLDSRFYMGKNRDRLQQLLYQCGFAQNLPERFFFVASTMFWARPRVFEPLLSAGLSLEDFESEPIPLDGSLAHALERFFGLLVSVQGNKIAAVDAVGNLEIPDPYAIYPFATAPAHLRLRDIKSVVYYPAYEEAYAIEHLRVTAPFRAAGLQLINGGKDPQLASMADAVLFQREFPRNLPLYDEIVATTRLADKFILYEIDDLLFDLPDNHPERTQELYNSALMPMLSAMTDADLVLVPTQELRQIVEGYNPNVIVLPNYLDDNLWQLKKPGDNEGDDLISIGYMGSESHTPDLATITPALLKILNKYQDKIRLEVYGTPLPESLKGQAGVSWHPTPTNIYTEFVKFFQGLNFDLVIAPLADNLFNRCKSGLKFLEYSAIGAPGVYSRIAPYETVITDGIDGYLAASEDEWLDKLTLLIENPDQRLRIAQAAQQNVREKWLLSANIRSWHDIFNKLNREIFLEDPRKPLRAHIANTINRQLFFDRANATARYANLEANSTEIIDQLNRQLSQTIQQLDCLTRKYAKANEEVKILAAQLNERNNTLDQIYNSREWKVFNVYRQGRLKLSKATRNLHSKTGPLSKIFPARLNAQKDLLVNSGLFDSDYYLRLYPDVHNAGVDPVEHYLRFGGAEARDPSPDFDSSWYLEHNPDVRNAGINPLLHYLRFGKQEGRTIQAVDWADRSSEVQAQFVAIPEEKKIVPVNIMLAPQLKKLLSDRLKSQYRIALSHDDYLEVTGGAQITISGEQRLVNEIGQSYLHIYPYKKSLTLLSDESLLYLGLNLDGKALAETESSELLGVLAELGKKELIKLSIHQSMGFNQKTLQSLLNLTGGEGIFWLHDYFSLCPSYNLRRNDAEFCGAPEIGSNACRLCHYSEQRAIQQPIFERLFRENKLEVVAPSRFNYEFWQSRFPVKVPAHIIPPAILKWRENSPSRYEQGALRVGFLGYPLDYKGWPVWLRLTKSLTDNKGLKFFHFSTSQGEPGNYRRIETQVTKENRNAMVESLRWNQIDVALLWSTVAETFSFTMHEALAAGCFILTNPSSGNIQDYIRRHPECGLVLKDEEGLIELFKSGNIIEAVREYQKNGKPQADLIFGSLEEVTL